MISRFCKLIKERMSAPLLLYEVLLTGMVCERYTEDNYDL